MASYDGTNKSSAGCAQHLPYWEIKTEHTKNLYNEAMAMATPEAVAFCDPDNYQGPDIEVDASTLTEEQWQARRADHLGGSDISAIFGENHFKTNLDLYYAKTGKVPAVPEEESSASRLNSCGGISLRNMSMRGFLRSIRTTISSPTRTSMRCPADPTSPRTSTV